MGMPRMCCKCRRRGEKVENSVDNSAEASAEEQQSGPGGNSPVDQSDADRSRSGQAEHRLRLVDIELPAFARKGRGGSTGRVAHAVQSEGGN